MKVISSEEGILVAEQWLPASIAEVFSFFSDAENLERLTPEWLHFKVLGKSTPAMQQGTLIDYRLSLHGIPLRWQSRIDRWTLDKEFVDTQVRGPYRLWHHTHEFKAIDGGTLVTDRVRYEVPGGFLGRLLVGKFVRRDVIRIFEYRAKRMQERFPE